MRNGASEHSVETEIGLRIRALRSSRDISLDQLADQVRLTKGQLSKIENGRVSSPVSTLTRIASALGADVGALFTDDKPHRSAVLVKEKDRKVIVGRGTKMGHTYESLAFGLPFEKAFEPYMMAIDKRKIDPRRNVFKHPGHEFLFMVQGTMDYRHDGETYHLEPGDSFFFDASLEHGPVEVSRPPVRFLSIISNPLLHR